MKKFLVLAAAAASLSATQAGAAPFGTFLFTQNGVEIIGIDGKARPARQGDVVETGERIVTPEGAITQLKLTDGSLLAMRPGSELKVDLPSQIAGEAQRLVSLVHGAVRMIGSELMDKLKPSAVTLQTGQATLQLSGADIESAVLRSGSPKLQAAGEPGSYNRLLAGEGTIRSGAVVEPLQLRQVSFVSPVSSAPTVVSSFSPALFSAANSTVGESLKVPALVKTPSAGAAPAAPLMTAIGLNVPPGLSPMLAAPPPSPPVAFMPGPAILQPTLIMSVPSLPSLTAPSLSLPTIVPKTKPTCIPQVIGGKKTCI